MREKIAAAWPDYGRSSLSSFQLRKCRLRALRKDWENVGDFSIPENKYGYIKMSKEIFVVGNKIIFSLKLSSSVKW